MTEKLFLIKEYDKTRLSSQLFKIFKNEDNAKAELKRLTIENEWDHIHYYYTTEEVYD